MPQSVKVVCIGPSVTVRGGISRLIENLKRALPRDIRFRVIATYSDYIGDAEVNRWTRCLQPVVYLRSMLQILKEAITQHSAIFHVHFSQRGSTVRKGVVCIMLRMLRCRYIVHGHTSEDALFHNWVPMFARRALLWGIGGGRYVIALTQFWRDYYLQSLNVAPNKLLVLPNPADIPEFIPNRINRKSLELLFLGRLGERKGTFELIRAFAVLPNAVREHSHLTLAGDGETDAALDLATDLGCSLQISILGWVEPLRIKQLLAKADIFVLPSRGEGMSMALLEAMAWSLPVVTTLSGGTDDFLFTYHNCILVKPGDVQGIARALYALAADPNLRLRLGVEARKTAKHFSVDRYIDELSSLYKQIANEPLKSSRPQAVVSAKL
jgi:glycosyltransferase involved in cell wall biosynthesis